MTVAKALRISGTGALSLLALLPLAVRAFSSITRIALPSADLAQVNLVFVFAGLAGTLATEEGRHLSLGMMDPRKFPAVRRVTGPALSFLTAFVLAALFATSLSEVGLAFKPDERVWGIPLMLIFAALPATFLSMAVIAFARAGHRLSAAIGAAVGLLSAAGPISGIFATILGGWHLPLAPEIFEAWCAFAHAAFIPIVLAFIAGAALGLPLYVAISGISYVAFSQGGGYVEMIPLEFYGILTDKSIASIPLFTLAGFLLAEGSAGKRLIEVMRRGTGWLRGGPAIATVLVTAFFTTFTGASGVTILALGGLLTVILSGSGYDKDRAQSLITASGALGILFPPSLAIIIYATTNVFSVDAQDLFRGSILPGCLMLAGTMVLGVLRAPKGQTEPFSSRELARALRDGWAELLLPVCVIALYFSGLFTLMETAAFTALYAFSLEVFFRRDFSWRKALAVAYKSVPIAGGVLIIVGAAKALAYFLIDAGIPFTLADLVSTYVHSKILFLLLLNVFLLVVGCLMDLYSAILVVSPLVIPMAESFGLHPVHVGVIFLANLAIGFLTPPVGMNLFIASYAFDKPVARLARDILPFLAVQLATLLIITYVPILSLLFVK